MDFIYPHLALGSLDDVPLFPDGCITRVLTLCEARPHTEILAIYRPIPDEIWLPSHVWQGLVDDLRDLLINQHTVLVHCRLGVSRSPGLVTAYLARHHSMTLNEALQYVSEKRSCVKIHEETLRGIREWHHGPSL